jgi:hypothetical protein
MHSSTNTKRTQTDSRNTAVDTSTISHSTRVMLADIVELLVLDHTVLKQQLHSELAAVRPHNLAQACMYCSATSALYCMLQLHRLAQVCIGAHYYTQLCNALN